MRFFPIHLQGEEYYLFKFTVNKNRHLSIQMKIKDSFNIALFEMETIGDWGSETVFCKNKNIILCSPVK